MGLLAEARSKNKARESGNIPSGRSVGLLAEARAIKNPQETASDPVIDSVDSPTATGRTGRVKRQLNDKDIVQQQIQSIEAGEISASELAPRQVEKVREQRISEIPEIAEMGLKNLVGADGMEGFSAALVGMTTFNPEEFAEILTKQFPQIGISQTPDGQFIAVNNKTGAVANINREGPSLMDALQVGGVISAFTPGARIAASAPQAASRLIGRGVASPTGIRAAAQGIGAGATEAGIQKAQEQAGGEFNVEEVALAGGLGVAGEVVPRAVQAGGRRVRQAVTGAEETAEQAARRALLEPEIGAPTRAQVTRDAGEFQAQQELAKTSTPVRARLEQQEARLQGAFEQAALDTNGNIVTSTSTPIDEVLRRSIDLDQRVSDLYRQVREVAPEAENIRLTRMATALRNMQGEDRVSGGLASSMRQDLRNRGIIDANGRSTGRRVSVEEAEQIRVDINQLYDSLSDRGRQLSRTLKDNLDNDVFIAAGRDFFDRARTAKSNFEQGLSRAQISKFDKRKANIIRDILDNKISPDTFINDVVFAKKWRTEDLNQLRSYLNQTSSGQQAWNDLKAQTVEEIRRRSFTGPIREDGVTQSLSRAGLEKTLNALESKSNVLFDAQERAFFERMRDVSRLREPPPGTFAGKGPSAQAISQAKARFPIIGPIIDSLSEFRQNRLLLRLPRRARGQQTPRTVPAQTAQALRTEDE